MKTPVAVLVSGRGSNLAALLDAQAKRSFRKVEIRLVVSNVSGVEALEKAKTAHVRTRVVSHKDYVNREAFDHALLNALRSEGIEWICLAGFMRLLGPTITEAYPHRILNIHPSLLPAFPGLRVQRAALEYGVRYSGCTVHFVDGGLDTGPIIMQRVVPIHDTDTEATLTGRILAQEHVAYPEALRMVTENRFWIEGRRVRFGERLG